MGRKTNYERNINAALVGKASNWLLNNFDKLDDKLKATIATQFVTKAIPSTSHNKTDQNTSILITARKDSIDTAVRESMDRVFEEHNRLKAIELKDSSYLDRTQARNEEDQSQKAEVRQDTTQDQACHILS